MAPVASRLLIRGQWGLGDNIYARPFVRAASKRYDLFLETPWPELFEDLPVRFVKGERRLRTQTRNVARQPATRWHDPKGIQEARIGYGHSALQLYSLPRALARQWNQIGVQADWQDWDLPDMGEPPITSTKPIAFVRPVTVRREWRNEARNCRPEYVNQICDWLSGSHEIVSVADLSEGQEWLEGDPPQVGRAFLSGEFNVRELLALVSAADVVVGAVGWIVPALIALKRKAFVVLGGHGGHNAPEKITDPRMDLTRLRFARPDTLCPCNNMQHRCDKTISNLRAQWDKFAATVLAGPPLCSKNQSSAAA